MSAQTKVSHVDQRQVASSSGGGLHLWLPKEEPHDVALQRLDVDRLQASILMDELHSAVARLVPDRPQILLEFRDIVAARMCFAMIWPERVDEPV